MNVEQFWQRALSFLKGQSPAPMGMAEASNDLLPNWTNLLATNQGLWEDAKHRARTGPKILLATSVGGFSALTLVESLLAVALTLRGAQVHTLLCDHALPACLRVERSDVPDPSTLERYELPMILCQGCYATGQQLYKPLGLENHVFSQLLPADEAEQARQIAFEVPFAQIEAYSLNGWAVGEHAYAGALRYFASGNLENEPAGEMVARRYLEGALRTAFVMQRLLKQSDFTAACFNHGIYSPQGVVGEVCRRAGVRVINWNVAYRKRCFIFSHDETYHHTLLSEPTSSWDKMPWDEEMDRQIVDYLKSRRQGTRDWIWYHEKPDEAFEGFANNMGLDLTKPIIGMLTNVMWDAQLHYRANAFPNMLAWVIHTIEYFQQHPDRQLLIRIHPAEIRGTMPSRQPILLEIQKIFPRLPSNVFVIPPESPVSTYAAMLHCKAVLIYGTKTGVELTSMKIPVVVAGEAWIRNKGLTIDASSPDDYNRILDRLPDLQEMASDQVVRARKYAYHFFFRRMIPISCMEPTASWPPYRLNIRRLNELLPGKDPGLDLICDGILSHSPFVYPSEKLGIHDA
jgi:hypothetical protein